MLIQCAGPEVEDWLALRQALWPHASAQQHRQDIEKLLQRRARSVAFMARVPDAAFPGSGSAVPSVAGSAACIAFAEAVLRDDYVNGCQSSPVLFLEGLYVAPAFRRQGVARRLCTALEQWGLQQGCTEFASDTALSNFAAQEMHRALGFAPTERVVFFRKPLNA
ncbi:GNAT family N-acetyltransferase [Paraburkholderia hayleyella]|uniref:GNAT family N-acetyltransferase n=1 Tax=Paraburkholderia hayleyella TaxID=2152889 RepID=UPI00129116E1|nr:GNAT family N-acetyltransferase [Paraburkholderia hayleyella]